MNWQRYVIAFDDWPKFGSCKREKAQLSIKKSGLHSQHFTSCLPLQSGTEKQMNKQTNQKKKKQPFKEQKECGGNHSRQIAKSFGEDDSWRNVEIKIWAKFWR